MKTRYQQTLLMFLLGLCLWPSVGRSQSEFNDDARAFRTRIERLLLDQQREELEAIIQRLRREHPAFLTGRPQLIEFYEALSATPREDDGKRSPQLAVERVAHLRAWHLAKPSVTTHIALANALVESAWAYRGDGFADTIAPKAKNEMEASLNEAQTLLTAADNEFANAPAKDPYLYYVSMRVGVLRAYSSRRMRELLDDSLKADPQFSSTIDVLCQYLLPRWYGADGDLLRLAEDIAEQTKDATGDAAYAIVAINALHYGEISGFADDGFAWPRVRQGLRDWLKPVPDSPYRWSVLAKFSHLANDQKAAAEAISKLDGRWHTRVFTRREDFLRTERWASAQTTDVNGAVVIEFGPRPILDVLYVLKGQGVVPGTRTRNVEIRSVRDGSLLNEYQLEKGKVELLDIDETGQYVVFTSPRSRETHVALLDLESGQQAALGTQQGRIRTLSLSRDHKYVLAGNDRGQIKRWENAETPIPIEWNAGQSDKISGMALTPDGTSLITVAGTQASFWELATRSARRSWTVHPTRVRTVACSPDGKIISTAGFGNEVKLWRVEDGAEAGTLVGGNTSIQSLAFSSDGKRLVAGTMSAEQPQIPGEVIVWDVESKRALPPLTGHRLGIWKIAVAPDGSQIASASEDGTVRLWPMPK